jgi:hypothetical protein
MFVRVKRLRTNGRDYQYLQVVETRRERAASPSTSSPTSAASTRSSPRATSIG